MARQWDIQYINAYVSGTTAYQVQPVVPKKKKPVHLPKPRKEKRIPIAVDPVAIMSIAVALVLAVALLVSFVELGVTIQKNQQMEAYLQQLQEDNQRLQEQYEAGYDLDYIRETALAMGLVPMEQVQHIQMAADSDNIVDVEIQMSVWEAFCAFVTGLFA